MQPHLAATRSATAGPMPFDPQGSSHRGPHLSRPAPAHEAVVEEQPLHPPLMGQELLGAPVIAIGRLELGSSISSWATSGPVTPPGRASVWPERPGWPNALSGDDRIAPAHLPDSYEFNSPHSLATDADGNLYVSEWLIGGRYAKLKIRG